MRATAIIMILIALLFAASSCAPSESTKEPESTSEQSFPIVTRVPSDLEGIDFIITYDPKVAKQDYVAEVSSSIPLTDTYAIERGADNGLVFLVFEDMRRIEEYVISHEVISAVVQIRYDMDVYDKTDIVFTQENVVMVHTSTSNAGIFTSSDVYILPHPETGFEYIDLIRDAGKEHEHQLDILHAALLFYYSKVACHSQ